MTQQRHSRTVAWGAAAALLLTGCSSATEERVEPSPPAIVASDTSSPSASATSLRSDSAATTSSDDPLEPTTVVSETPSAPESATTTSPEEAAQPSTSAETTEGQAATSASPSTSDAPDTSTTDEAPDTSTTDEAPDTSTTDDEAEAEAEAEAEPAAVAASGSAAGAAGAEVVVYDAPSGTATRTFSNPTARGVPLTFMVTSTADGWVQVQLPVRPNGSTGWVRAADVTVFEVDYLLKVSTADNTLDVYRDGALIYSFPVATGTGETPTPRGTYYLTELIAPTNDGYGPYAYGISAFSNVLNEFLGGPGQIGLHGTDDTGSIGRAVSHGCIRLSNADITTLAALLPLGTPIQIT